MKKPNQYNGCEILGECTDITKASDQLKALRDKHGKTVRQWNYRGKILFVKDFLTDKI